MSSRASIGSGRRGAPTEEWDHDEALDVNLAWSGPGRIERETIGVIPLDISARMREVSAREKVVE